MRGTDPVTWNDLYALAILAAIGTVIGTVIGAAMAVLL